MDRRAEAINLITGLMGMGWLNQTFGGKFKHLGRRFLIGKQHDDRSCGLFVLNSMEHAMSGVKVLENKDSNLLRMDYFAKLAKYVCDRVSRMLSTPV